MTLVSVLVPAFAAQEFIARPVLSVINQTHAQWELIIASDDGADYQPILSAHGINDTRIYFTSTSHVQSGPSSARNAALQIASGDIVAVLDADDAFAPDKLEQLLPHVIGHGAATSDIRIIESQSLHEYPSLARRFPARLLTPQEYITANLHAYSILMWDRRRVNVLWDEQVPCMEDLIFGLCMYNNLEGIYYEPAPLHLYYKHPGSITNQTNTLSHKSDTAQQMIKSCQTLIKRAECNQLQITNKAVSNMLIHYLKHFIQLEEKFFQESGDDSVMEFYHFIQKNRDAFYFW